MDRDHDRDGNRDEVVTGPRMGTEMEMRWGHGPRQGWGSGQGWGQGWGWDSDGDEMGTGTRMQMRMETRPDSPQAVQHFAKGKCRVQRPD